MWQIHAALGGVIGSDVLGQPSWFSLWIPLRRQGTCVGLACAVADAAEPVQAIAHYVTQRRGGDGAVREVCEFLIAARQ